MIENDEQYELTKTHQANFVKEVDRLKEKFGSVGLGLMEQALIDSAQTIADELKEAMKIYEESKNAG